MHNIHIHISYRSADKHGILKLMNNGFILIFFSLIKGTTISRTTRRTSKRITTTINATTIGTILLRQL